MAGENEVTIIDAPAKPEEKKPVTTEEAKEVLDTKELEMAQKHGLVEDKKEEKKSEKPAEKAPEKPAETTKADIKEAVDKELTDEQEHDLLSGFNKNERGLYWKMKDERKKRQAKEAENEQLKIKLAVLEKNKDNKDKPAEDSEDKEIDDLFSEKTGEPSDKAEDKPLTKKDLEDHEKAKEAQAEEKRKAAEAVNTRINDLEKMGKTEFPEGKWEYLNKMAMEAMTADESKSLYRSFFEAVTDEKMDKMSVLKMVERYAKLSDNYDPNWKAEKAKGEKVDVDKVIENATRRSSASLGGGGTRKVSIDSLTPEDAAKMSFDEFAKLPKEVRERIRREAEKP